MIWKVSFNIIRWSAWSPQISDVAEWKAWLKAPGEVLEKKGPPVKFMKPNQRRRTSQLSKAALETAYKCLSPEQRNTVKSVFGSRHGETNNSQALLEMLGADEILSPMAFSLSVHNTVSGLFSITSGNKAPSTAISANKQTFCYTLLDALASLAQAPQEPVLAIVSEELVPDVLVKGVEECRVPFGLALLIKANKSEEGGVELVLDSAARSEAQDPEFAQSLTFIRWLLEDKEELSFVDSRIKWGFKKEAKDYADLFSAEYVEED